MQFKNIYIKELPPSRRGDVERRAVRALLITGGHEHERSFYSLFDGYKDLARLPVATARRPFKNDLRGKYDVIIMYDFSRDLDEIGQEEPPRLCRERQGSRGAAPRPAQLPELGLVVPRTWSAAATGCNARVTFPSSTVKNDQPMS